MLSFLNFIFTLAHLALILFNLTGWIWKRTRKAHMVVVGLTTASWFVLGIWYGWGYCPLTDWHWDVKEKLGETNLPNSFVKYYADKISGSNISVTLVDNVTLGCLVFAIVSAIYVNFIRKSKKN
jgi:hypothetical protein